MSLASLTDRRTMFLLLMAAPLTTGVAARADEADAKAIALAAHAGHLYQLLALEHLATGFWHLQTHMLLDAATAESSSSQTADLDALHAAATRMQEGARDFEKAIKQEAEMAPLRRLQLKNVTGTILHLNDDTGGIVDFLARADLASALALHRERSVPLFESLQRDMNVAASAIEADVREVATSI
jgi:hypothetical protein